jgi:putative transposase
MALPRIHAELRLEHGLRVGRKRVARLMKAAGIAPRKRWRTTIRVPGVEPASDLVERAFGPDAPNVLGSRTSAIRAASQYVSTR